MKNYILLLSVLPLLNCGGSTKPAGLDDAQPPAVEAVDPLVALEASVTETLNAELDPCDDFYQYACGGWLDSYELPDDKTRFTKSFGAIMDSNLEIQRKLLEDYAKNPDGEPYRKQLGTYWQSCMDTDAIDAAGFEPLKGTFARIDEMKSHADLMPTLGELGAEGLDGLFTTFVNADDKNPNLNIVIMTQGGTSLPDRSFYLDDSEERATIRTQYKEHITKMFVLTGASDEEAAKASDDVMLIELALAEMHLERQEMRDPTKIYNKLDKVGLQKLTPNMDWDAFFVSIGKPDATQINVTVPEVFEKLDAMLQATDLGTIQNYLKWMALHGDASHLSSDFADENFEFFAKTLYGSKADQPRWKKCVRRIDGTMGELLGRAYVDVAFSGDSKPIALGMIGDIEAAFSDGLGDLAWMDEATAERAVGKMGKIRNKIGYPDKWKDYSSLEFGESYFDNMLAARGFVIAEALDRIEQPVDKDLWFMSPPTVNAYYNPSVNEIVFPAGIMQAPFYDKAYPRAFNYGAIGMVMGHELTHGFDDSGSKYDGDGMLADWWEPDVIERFEEAGACVSDLYDTFEVQPDVFVNGKLTLGENIADLGGIKQSYRAYQKWAADQPDQPEVAGLTGEQQLFVGFAQGWCHATTDEQEAVFLKTDSHSPPRFRVNGPLQNFPAFGEAFECEVGSPMRPEKICEVW